MLVPSYAGDPGAYSGDPGDPGAPGDPGLGQPGFDEKRAIQEVIAALKGTSSVSGVDNAELKGQLDEKTAELAKADGLNAELNKSIGILKASEIKTKEDLEEYKQVVDEFAEACAELNGLLRDKQQYINTLLKTIYSLVNPC